MLIWILIIILIVVFIYFFVFDKRYHVAYHSDLSAVEKEEEYLLGFIEFDDQGMFWDKQAKQIVLETIRRDIHQDKDAIIVIYVHGWQHNARGDDKQLDAFKNLLKQFSLLQKRQAEKDQIKPCEIIGLYLGWQGVRFNYPLLSYLTFWDRKAVAERTGQRAASQLINEMYQIKKDKQSIFPNKQTKLVVLAHSLGANLAYNAIDQYIIDSVNTVSDQEQSVIDLACLINPSLDALRFETLYEVAEQKKHPHPQPPQCIVMSAQLDIVNDIIFPFTEFNLGLLDSYKDKEQAFKNTLAIGHFDGFITHYLKMPLGMEISETYLIDDKDFEIQYNLRRMLKPPLDYTPENPPFSAPFDLKSTELARKKGTWDSALWFLNLDKEMVKGHGIVNPQAEFLIPIKELLFQILLLTIYNEKAVIAAKANDTSEADKTSNEIDFGF